MAGWFSDITILHSYLNNNETASIHGAMPPFFFDEKGKPNESLVSLMDLLKGGNISYQIKPNERNRTGNVTAELIGGNLSIIASLLGTKYELKTEGKILFLEDIDEYLYHIDRIMRQLKLAGELEKLAGLVVGDFTGIKDNETPFGQTYEEIIWEVVKDYNYPVCFGFPAGHDKKNLALTFGKKWNLNVSQETSTLNL